MKYPDLEIGVFAAGANSYTKYRDLFDPIIKEHHGDVALDFEEEDLDDVLHSEELDYVKSVRHPEKRWTYWDQSMVKNVRLEMIRNIDSMPTLAGLTESSKR